MQANDVLLRNECCDYVRQLVSGVLPVGQRAISQELFDLFFAGSRTKKRAFHSVRVSRQAVEFTRGEPHSRFFRARSRLTEVAMPDRKSNTNRASCIARCRLNPNRIKWPFAEDAAITYAVESYSAGHA